MAQLSIIHPHDGVIVGRIVIALMTTMMMMMMHNGSGGTTTILPQQRGTTTFVVSAWTTTTPTIMGTTISTVGSLNSHKQNNNKSKLLFRPIGTKLWTSRHHTVVNNIDEEENDTARFNVPTTVDRRQFMKSSIVTSSILLVSTTTGIGNTANAAANAATTTTSVVDDDNTKIDYKYYTPMKDSLIGQVMIITGGTTGLGLESAKRLAYGGATVIITSRTDTKGQVAVNEIQDYVRSKKMMNNNNDDETNNNNNNVNVYYVTLDLDDLNNVKAFPSRLEQLFAKHTDTIPNKHIDVLMNNAGVMAIPTRELTKDGYERTFQSNHLGHFVLTKKLIPYLAVSNNPRIINVSSQAYQFASSTGLQIDNLNGEKQYGPWSSYGQSKLANILFTNELQKRANDAGWNQLTVTSLHPGAVQTDLARNLMGTDKWEQMKQPGYQMSFIDQLLFGTLQKFVLTVEQGASTQVYLAAATPRTTTSDKQHTIIGGEFYDECKVQKLPKFATDPIKAQQLWETSERLAGESFLFNNVSTM